MAGLDGVVQVLEQECHQDAPDETYEKGDPQIPGQIGFEGVPRDQCPVDDRDFVAGVRGKDTDFLLALEQTVVDPAVGVGFPFQCLEVGCAVTQGEDLAPDFSGACLQ